MEDIMHRLQEPFPAEDIEWRVGSTNGEKTKGMALAYLTNRAIMSRLDNIFGPFGWQNEFRSWKEKSQLCGISVKHGDEWITKWDGADDSNMEAVKGGLSDSMKRAAYQWGIGRYLYKLPGQWVAIKKTGNSYALAETPRLPQWALPQGHPSTRPATTTPPSTPQTAAHNPPQASGARPATGDSITDPQNKRIYAMSKKLQLDDAMRDIIAAKCNGKTSRKELTKREASTLIEYLGKLESGAEVWTPHGDAYEPMDSLRNPIEFTEDDMVF